MFKKIWNGIKKVVKCVAGAIRSIIGTAATTGGLAVACTGILVAPTKTRTWMREKLDGLVNWLDTNTSKKTEDLNTVDDENDVSNTEKEDEANVQENI